MFMKFIDTLSCSHIPGSLLVTYRNRHDSVSTSKFSSPFRIAMMLSLYSLPGQITAPSAVQSLHHNTRTRWLFEEDGDCYCRLE